MDVRGGERDYEPPNATDMQRKQATVVATHHSRTRSRDVVHIGVPSSGCSSAMQLPNYLVKETGNKIPDLAVFWNPASSSP
jgi:hypothetical protein